MANTIKQTLDEISKAAEAQGIEFYLFRKGKKHAIYHLGKTVVLPVPYSSIPGRIRFEMFKSCEPELGHRWWMPVDRRPTVGDHVPHTFEKGYRGPKRKIVHN